MWWITTHTPPHWKRLNLAVLLTWRSGNFGCCIFIFCLTNANLKAMREREKGGKKFNCGESQHTHHLIGSTSIRRFYWHEGRTILAAIGMHKRHLNTTTLHMHKSLFIIFYIAKKTKLILIHIVYNKKKKPQKSPNSP